MDEAFAQARAALAAKNVPVGCAFVENGTVIASAANDSSASTLHAEILCLYDLMRRPHEIAPVMSDVTCYLTLEPCIMCAPALERAGIHHVVFAAKNAKFGGVSGLAGTRKTTLECVHDPTREAESIALLQAFFEQPHERDAVVY